MKKISKKFLLVLLSILMLLTSIPVYAESEYQVMPRYANTNSSKFDFVASSSGAYANVSYTGNSSTFSYARLTVKVEKSFLWVFWSTVDEWTATSSDVMGSFYHVFSVSGSGNYRATFTLEVYGTNGSVDTLTETIESSY